MTKIDIVSGFLGAGKTTLIKKLLEEALQGQKIVLIENEFGEIGIDSGFLSGSGVDIREMNSGCICCSLVGDFGKALADVLSRFAPDRIIIEPSGVGKLSDVIRAVISVTGERDDISLASYTAVADVSKCRMYMKNFGEFYNNQIESAKTIVLSRTQNVSAEKRDAAIALIREKNAEATIVTTPWDDLTGAQLLAAMEEKSDFAARLLAEIENMPDEEEHHHHHHHDEDEEHEHHHHHDEDEEHEHHHHHDEDEEHEHHHHHDEDEEHEHHHHHDEDEEHEHHHHYDENGVCSCGHHHHGHEGHHHADEVFTSWGEETAKAYDREALRDVLEKMAESSEYGVILRAKGIVPTTDGGWIEFDMVPEELEIREGRPDVTGRLCVIGTDLKEEKIREAFGV